MTTTAIGPQGPNYSLTRPIADPVVSGGNDTWFVNCSAAGAKDGTYATADFFNVIIAQLRRAIAEAGITLDGTNDEMLRQAICATAMTYGFAVPTGTPDAMVLTLNPAPSAYVAGMTIKILMTGPNTTVAPVINLNGLGNVAVLKANGSAPGVGDLAGAYSAIFDGSAFRLQGVALSDLNLSSIPGRTQVFLTSGTFTVPAGVTMVEATVIGAGGAGGASADGTLGSTPSNGGGGGHGGGYAYRRISGLTPGANITVTVGAAGAAASAAAGGAGGTSSFGAYCSATGGQGGVFGVSSVTVTGVPGIGSGGDINVQGGIGGPSGNNGAGFTANMLYSVFCRGGLGAGGLGTLNFYGSGHVGNGYGTGGDGATGGSGLAGGNGAPGIVIVRW